MVIFKSKLVVNQRVSQRFVTGARSVPQRNLAAALGASGDEEEAMEAASENRDLS
jgi:hypothetical protein